MQVRKGLKNYCVDHPPCRFPECDCACEDHEIFCSKHTAVKSKCLAITKKGKACKGTPVAPTIWYCRDHLHLAKDIDFGSDSDDDSDKNSFFEKDDTFENQDPKEPIDHKCAATKRYSKRPYIIVDFF